MSDRFLRYSIFLLASVQLWAQKPVPEAALDVYTPAAFDEERVAGLFAERLRANIEGYLQRVDTAKLEKPFRERSSSALDPLSTEGAGLFLMAAAESYDYSDDPELKAVMDRVARGLIAAQEPDGYAGVYKGEARWGPGDVLTQASVLMGLMAYWRSTGDDASETAAHKMADLFLSTFGQKKAPADAVALLPGMAELYRSSGDVRYLNFCKSLAAAVTSTGDGALVMALRGFGLVELYRITGNDSYLNAARQIWQKTEQEHRSVAGLPASSESLDSCLTLAWFQLTLDLLRLTGQVEYASALEATIYNGLFAAQEKNTGGIDAAVPFTGKKKFGHGTDVCTAAAAVGIAELPGVVWGRYGYGIAIMGYVPGRTSVRLRRRASVQLYAEGNYPASGAILLHVEPSHDIRFPLRFYVPSWTKKFTADVGETHQIGSPGKFLIIDREWRRGDTVKIAIDMTPSIVSDPATGKRLAVRRGPQLLALSSSLNARLGDLASVSLDKSAAATLKQEESTTMPTGLQTYSIVGNESGKTVKLLLIPFSDATDYRVWLQPAGM
ncbi:MAG TPA: beta-L-arabinofuranosidase domain-containing protein [Bryobacteraceae bacterium]|jgi:hypothetical protein|nr:beta-L-arabinofuranosidase domain-containing protein [Bryobacteraceae bacterium]